MRNSETQGTKRVKKIKIKPTSTRSHLVQAAKNAWPAWGWYLFRQEFQGPEPSQSSLLGKTATYHSLNLCAGTWHRLRQSWPRPAWCTWPERATCPRSGHGTSWSCLVVVVVKGLKLNFKLTPVCDCRQLEFMTAHQHWLREQQPASW